MGGLGLTGGKEEVLEVWREHWRDWRKGGNAGGAGGKGWNVGKWVKTIRFGGKVVTVWSF